MATAEEKIAQELRNELEARINGWKAERAIIIASQGRLAELDALIAAAEDNTKTSFTVAPRPKRAPIDVAKEETTRATTAKI